VLLSHHQPSRELGTVAGILNPSAGKHGVSQPGPGLCAPTTNVWLNECPSSSGMGHESVSQANATKKIFCNAMGTPGCGGVVSPSGAGGSDEPRCEGDLIMYQIVTVPDQEELQQAGSRHHYTTVEAMPCARKDGSSEHIGKNVPGTFTSGVLATSGRQPPTPPISQSQHFLKTSLSYVVQTPNQHQSIVISLLLGC